MKRYGLIAFLLVAVLVVILATIAVAILVTVICFAIARAALQNAPIGTVPSLTSWPMLATAGLFCWLSLTLHSMRIRDIGWDPVCVVPGWIAATIIATPAAMPIRNVGDASR